MFNFFCLVVQIRWLYVNYRDPIWLESTVLTLFFAILLWFYSVVSHAPLCLFNALVWLLQSGICDWMVHTISKLPGCWMYTVPLHGRLDWCSWVVGWGWDWDRLVIILEGLYLVLGLAVILGVTVPWVDNDCLTLPLTIPWLAKHSSIPLLNTPQIGPSSQPDKYIRGTEDHQIFLSLPSCLFTL